MDTMHIYAQRGGKRPGDSLSNLSKSHSLQSLYDTSLGLRSTTVDMDKKPREEQERKPKPQKRQSRSNDTSPKHEKKKALPKKEPPQTITTTKNSSNVEKPSTVQNGKIYSRGVFLIVLIDE
jgi:hypothetical protein